VCVQIFWVYRLVAELFFSVLVSLLLACLLFFLLQFLRLLRLSKGIEKGILKIPSEGEQKRLNTHHRLFFFVFNLFGETLGCQIYLFFLLGFVWNGFNLQFDQNFLASKRERTEENNTDHRIFF
jgi:Ca2+/Na+ antiporter